tara:strand:- start:1834 stop:1989 length:156 start_codon:yes stop_codon:yes gene_type:complete
MNITAKNTKAEILEEAIPLIDDQAAKIQDLSEKLNFMFWTAGLTAIYALLF